MFPLFGSGSGTYARELAVRIAKNHTVAMVVPDKRTIPNVTMFPLTLHTKIAFSGHPDWPNCGLYTKVSGKDLSANYLEYFHGVVNAMNTFQPDIVHVHHLMPLTWITRFIKIAYGVNYVITAHGSEIPTLKQDKRYPFLTAESLRKAVRVVANSNWTKEWIQGFLGIEFNSKIRIIPGGVTMSDFPEELSTREVEEKYKLGNKKLVLFTGKLTKYKGVKYLISAAKNIDAIVGIAGSGPERKTLEEFAKEINAKNVKFFGKVQNHDLIQLYYAADVCVVPSVWDEPLGLVILEAMAAKTPVVVTRKGGIPLMVKDGYNGYFVRSRNSKDIVEKVKKLLVNDNLRDKMGERARQTVKERFTWEKIAERYENIYKEYRKVQK